METESIIQIERTSEIKKCRNLNRSYRGKLHQRNTRDEDRNSGIEGMMEEKVKSKNILIQNTRNMVYYEYRL